MEAEGGRGDLGGVADRGRRQRQRRRRIVCPARQVIGRHRRIRLCSAKQNDLRAGAKPRRDVREPVVGNVQGGRGRRRLEQSAGLLPRADRSARQERVADFRCDIHPDVQDASQTRKRSRSAEVLRLGLFERRRQARGCARLRAVARQRYRANSRNVEGADKGRFREAGLLSNFQIRSQEPDAVFALSSDAAFSIPVIIARLPRGVTASTVRMPDPKQKNIKLQDLIFRAITRTFAFLVLAVLLAIIGSLIYGSLPAMRKFGLGFLASADWNPVTEQFGALVPIIGTLATSIIA